MRKIVWLLALVIVLYSISTLANSCISRILSSASIVTGQPTITASLIDQVLCSAGSPACHTGEALYEQGVQYHIDPVYALAFFQEESFFGRLGVARFTHSLGNIRCTSGYDCRDGYRTYARWSAGYEDWYRLISYYVDTLHLRTVEQIIPTYAPSSENDVAAYITAVEHAVDAWHSQRSA
jgi:hypothetical protein